MSFVEDPSGLGVGGRDFPAGVTPVNRTRPTRPEKPFELTTESSRAVSAAAFRLHNDVYNGIEFALRPQFEADPDHNPLDVIEGTRFETDYLDNFIGSRSEAETRSIMTRIEQEERDRDLVARSGAYGMLASMAAGVASPVTLIPAGGWLYKGVQAGRITGAALAATEAGLIAGGSVGVQEGILQTTQETRRLDESLWNIGSAAVIGSALGGVVGATLGRRGLDDLAAKSKDGLPATAEDEARMWGEVVRGSEVGAASTDSARGTGELKGAFGVEQAIGFQDPLLRLQTSPFTEARSAVRDLAETPLTLAENAEGIPTTIGGAVETQMKMAEAPLDQAMTDLDRAFADYFFGKETRFATTRAAGAALFRQTGGKMSYAQFKEAVWDALLAGDAHPVPQVQRAANSFRSRVFEPLKNEAIEQRLFSKDVAPLDDAGYVPRVYNTDRIAAERPRFVEILTKHFESRQAETLQRLEDLERQTGADVPPSIERDAANLSRDEIRDIAEQVTDTILGHSPQRLLTPADLAAGPRGPLKERVLRIPTTLIRDFVERDPEVLGRMYVRTMSADIGLVKKFGSTDLAEQIRKINDEANAKIKAAKSASERTRLDKQRTATVRDLIAIRDRIRGTYGIPSNPDGLLVRSGRVLRNLNYMRLLGGMTISAVPDIAKVLFAADKGGFGALRTAWHPLVRGLKTFKLAAKEAKLAGTALDMTLDSRVMAIADVMDDYGRGSKFERGLSSATRKFGIVSLMAPWNAAIKQFVGIIAQTRMLQSIERLAAGKASAKEIEYLAAGGIDANMAGRIYEQFSGSRPNGPRRGAPPPASFSPALWAIESAPIPEGEPLVSASRVRSPNSSAGMPSAAGDKVIYVDGKIAAFLTFHRDGDQITITHIETAESARRRGYARLLVSDLFAEFPEASVSTNVRTTDGRALFGSFGTGETSLEVPRPGPSPAVAPRRGVKDGDVWWANTEAWEDRQAVQSFRAFMVREIDKTIVTPGQDKPLWMSSEVGKLIGQFRSFNVASMQRTLLAGLQQRDMAALNGALLMMALGALTYKIKSDVGGYAVSDDPKKWAVEALDRSGLTGWLSDANNISEKVTRGRVGLSAFTGETASRYASRNALGALLGPSFDLVGDAITLTGAASMGEWKESDTHTLRKVMPLQNLFYLRALFDAVEAGSNSAFGVPARAN